MPYTTIEGYVCDRWRIPVVLPERDGPPGQRRPQGLLQTARVPTGTHPGKTSGEETSAPECGSPRMRAAPIRSRSRIPATRTQPGEGQ